MLRGVTRIALQKKKSRSCPKKIAVTRAIEIVRKYAVRFRGPPFQKWMDTAK
jgi:hypothetical protein